LRCDDDICFAVLDQISNEFSRVEEAESSAAEKSVHQA